MTATHYHSDAWESRVCADAAEPDYDDSLSDSIGEDDYDDDTEDDDTEDCDE